MNGGNRRSRRSMSELVGSQVSTAPLAHAKVINLRPASPGKIAPRGGSAGVGREGIVRAAAARSGTGCAKLEAEAMAATASVIPARRRGDAVRTFTDTYSSI